METNVAQLIELKLKQLKKASELARYEFDVVEKKEDVVSLLDSLIHEGQSCSVGGSVTLAECGILKYLENRKDITYLDRYHTDNPDAIFKAAISCDAYITSTNALTMNAELYNVDGNGNRVAAMIFGPKKVFVIVGINKIVNNLDEAVSRVRSVAAPANNIRLKKPNPCTLTGKCMDCRMETRICSAAVTISNSAIKGRIHLIVVKEALGY